MADGWTQKLALAVAVSCSGVRELLLVLASAAQFYLHCGLFLIVVHALLLQAQEAGAGKEGDLCVAFFALLLRTH